MNYPEYERELRQITDVLQRQRRDLAGWLEWLDGDDPTLDDLNVALTHLRAAASVLEGIQS